MAWQTQAAAAVFAATFLLLALGRIGRRNVPRGAVSLAGGLLTMLLLRLSWTAIDVEVLLLLAGLMALAAMADGAGLFWPLLRLADVPGRSALPVACLVLAVASAALLNDAAVVVLIPLLLPALRRRGIDGVAATVWLAVAANVGSLLTPFGNPQNAVLARAAGLGVLEFAAQQLVVFAVAAVLVAVPAMRHKATPARAGVHPERPPAGRAWAPAIGVVGFIAAAVAWPDRLGTAAALAAAGVFALLRPTSGAVLDRRVARGIDLNVLALFAGLYLLTAGIGQWFPSERLAPASWDRWQAAGIVLAISTAVGNVPAVLALQGLDPAWVADRAPFLVSISTLGGSMLLTGSAATLLAAEAARRQGIEVPFGAFARTAAPWMAVATAFAAWWMW